MLRGDNRRAMHALRWFAALVALGIAFTALAAAGLPFPGAGQQEALPTLAELEAQGATIGEIRVETQNIFDVDDPHESALPYRAANFLHITTQPWLIRRLLLFKTGEPVQIRLIDETVRLIRQSSSVYDVSVRPLRYQDGIVDLEVRTRDTWTLEPGLRFRRAGGVNSGAINIRETNFLGTGTTLGYERTTSVDRS